jgi:hypothetical protein
MLCANYLKIEKGFGENPLQLFIHTQPCLTLRKRAAISCDVLRNTTIMRHPL